MDKQEFNTDKIISFWITGSDDDFETMQAMYDTKRYSWSLFLGHIMIEKLLKAYYVQVNKTHPPFTHNLLKLAKESQLEIDEEIKVQLTTITAFNINTRYDDYKRSFSKKCTPTYTEKWSNIIKDLRLWI